MNLDQVYCERTFKPLSSLEFRQKLQRFPSVVVILYEISQTTVFIKSIPQNSQCVPWHVSVVSIDNWYCVLKGTTIYSVQQSDKEYCMSHEQKFLTRKLDFFFLASGGGGNYWAEERLQIQQHILCRKQLKCTVWVVKHPQQITLLN